MSVFYLAADRHREVPPAPALIHIRQVCLTVVVGGMLRFTGYGSENVMQVLDPTADGGSPHRRRVQLEAWRSLGHRHNLMQLSKPQLSRKEGSCPVLGLFSPYQAIAPFDALQWVYQPCATL